MNPEYKEYLRRYSTRELLHLAEQAPGVVRGIYDRILKGEGLNTDGMQFTLGGSFGHQREEEETINDSHRPDTDVKIQGARGESWASRRISLMQRNTLVVQKEADGILERRGGKGPIPPIQILFGTEDYPADAKDWG